ncbi:mechanosensitive ion channel domain-containing protein [Candidatus Omnitrophota bacterium]
MKKKLFLIIWVLIIACGLMNMFCVSTKAQDQSKVAEVVEKDQQAAQIKEKIKEVKQEAKSAKAEAEKAQIEAEKAKKEAEIQKKAAELEKQKLDVEIKETEASKREAELAKKAAASKGEVKKAVEKAKQEELEDKIAEEKAKVTQEKMFTAQQKALVAEEELKLAQQKLAIAFEKIKEKSAQRSLVERALESGGIIVVGLLFLLLLKLGVRKFENILTKKDAIRESETTLQVKTMIKLLNWIGTIVICVIIIYMVLEKHGLNVAPLLASAGIVGLAFGFGGQYLIRDLINGIFILIEGQYRINDVVKVGEHGGLVEDINLRITTLRDLEGRVIIVPNGEIKTVVNYTRGYAQALLDIGVAYKENVDKVMDVIQDIAKEMRKDSYFGRLIKGDLEMFGVDNFADSAVIIKFRIKTLPIKQWEVMREFRRRIKNKFDELGIEIPFPHRTLYWGTGSDNRWVRELAEKTTGTNNDKAA